jgi:hypothetical protein
MASPLDLSSVRPALTRRAFFMGNLKMSNQKKCPVCEKSFETVFAMQQHFADAHRHGVVPVASGIPDSTVDGSTPDHRCENCRYWGKANNLTVCRLKPGVPAMIQTTVGPQLVSLFPPANSNEWCGSWDGKLYPEC